MKKYLLVLLMVPLFSYADEVVLVKNMSPVVKFYPSNDLIQIKDKKGNEYAITTTCEYSVDEITEFTVRSRRVREGTPIRFSREKICAVESITRT